LRFPHHENENAQNVALYHRNIADFFIHVGHITVDGEKMSKSLNNFHIVKDLLQKFTSNDLRWFFYQTQYTRPLNFSIKLLEDSSYTLKKLFQQINNVHIQMLLNNYTFVSNEQAPDNEFIMHLENDLDFANTISVVHAQVKSLSKLIKAKDFDKLAMLVNSIVKEFDILGLKYESPINNAKVSSIIME
jgi:cysteinyl-tRNA synthetase